MKKNIGAIDRFIRLLVASGLLYLGLIICGGSVLGIGLASVAIIPFLTAIVGNCPFYNLLGINTCTANSRLNSK